jgi:hypothetical protein
MLVSQPFATLPSQSAKPLLHVVTLHVPLLAAEQVSLATFEPFTQVPCKAGPPEHPDTHCVPPQAEVEELAPVGQPHPLGSGLPAGYWTRPLPVAVEPVSTPK